MESLVVAKMEDNLQASPERYSCIVVGINHFLSTAFRNHH